MKKHILLTAGALPVLGTGSGIILKRHIERLELSGWKITVVVPQGKRSAANEFPKSWNVIYLVFRRWWWPPFRWGVPGSLKLRLFFWRMECERALCRERPSAVLTHVTGNLYSVLAVELSRSWNIPLSGIFHDQEELWQTSGEKVQLSYMGTTAILNQASRIWPVSQELSEVLRPDHKQKASILYPIPKGRKANFAKWRDHFLKNPVIAHAGYLYPWHFNNFLLLSKALEKVNGTLLIIAPGDDLTLHKLLEHCTNIRHCEPFKENSDAVEYLAEHASCILVSYSFSSMEQSWAATSFPSKLVEFSHIGLPTLILAPPFSAISKWAKQYEWICHVDELDESMLLKIANKIVDKNEWQKMALQIRKLSLTEFHPDYIQLQFERELATLPLQ